MTTRDKVIQFVEAKGQATRKEIIRFIYTEATKRVLPQNFDKNYFKFYRGCYSCSFSATYLNGGRPSFLYPSRKNPKHLYRIKPGVYGVTTEPPTPTNAEAYFMLAKQMHQRVLI